MKGIGRVVAWVVCFAAGGVRGQEYVLEPLPLAPLQAKWAVGWDAGRLLRGQAVATLERWLHPEFSVQAMAGALVTKPLTGWAVLASEVDASTLAGGSTIGLGVRFHPNPAPDAPLRAFVGFEAIRDRYEIATPVAANVWVHRELRALIGATREFNAHWSASVHVAVNATRDRFARRTYHPGASELSAPGRVAGIQLSYRW